jgi:hypothetical protein
MRSKDARSPPGRQPDRDPDVAGIGELNGVPDEVDQDLAEPRRIDLDARGDGSIPVDAQGEALLDGAGAHERGDLVDQLGGRARHALERHATGLDLRQVEDVVQDAEEMLAVSPDGAELLGLLGPRDTGLRQKPHVAEDGGSSACGSRGSCWRGTRPSRAPHRARRCGPSPAPPRDGRARAACRSA